jgi:RHS repeat-associated protein
MQMQLASIPVLSQPPLAAMPQLSEKPHQGFATKKTAWNPGPNVCNFTVTLGLQVAVVENGVRKTYSARYYNPATGRFMSRDPENGKAKDPKTLHKYLYASGDPVNRIDPSGRGDLVELSLQTWNAIKNALAEEEELHMVRKVFQCIAEMLSMIGYEPAELSDWMIEGCIESL